MKPAIFPEANAIFGPPRDLEESQCGSIPAYLGKIDRGSCEGSHCVVVAYDLTEQEIAHLLKTKRLFLSMLGGLAPHFLSFNFQQATNPQ